MGQLLEINFQNQGSSTFDRMMEPLGNHSKTEGLRAEETVRSFPGVEIYPDESKRYRDWQELHFNQHRTERTNGDSRALCGVAFIGAFRRFEKSNRFF